MAKTLSDDELLETLKALRGANGNFAAAADNIEMPVSTFRSRVKIAQRQGFEWPPKEEFEIEKELPDEIDLPALVERRKKQFKQKSSAEQARALINVKVKIDGPFAVTHFGDPHVDDDGTDIGLLERHVQICRDTVGMFAGNVGDLQNNWVGRLARLYGEQSTSAMESWALTEWLVGSIDWLYIIGGNHDCWSGAGDPLKWMMRFKNGIHEAHGARLSLVCPSGRSVRINARHDFAGHSMWNTAHGPAKAIQMGWRDHVLTCGHKHVSGYQVLKCPATGLVSHALRIAGYKTFDRYAKQLGLPNQNVSPAVVTVFDPQYADDDPRLVTVIHDVEEGAEYLAWKRSKA